jgi:hypothetical protein
MPRQKKSATIAATPSALALLPRAAERRPTLTLGDIVAATFEVAGKEVRSVARLLASPDMERLIGRRIVVT